MNRLPILAIYKSIGLYTLAIQNLRVGNLQANFVEGYLRSRTISFFILG